MPSSVEVSPERCASGEKRTSPSATPQQTAYTSGGETGRGEKPATRGRRKGEEPKLRIDDRGKKKKKKARAQPPRSSLPGSFPSSFPLRKGSDNFTRPGSKFCAEAGSGRAWVSPRAASHLRAGRGRGTPAPAATGGRRAGPPPGQAAGGGGARGSDSFLFDLERLPVVIVCGPAWGPLGALGVPSGAAVISAPSAPPPPRPHWPGAGRCHLPAEGRDPRPHSPPRTRERLSPHLLRPGSPRAVCNSVATRSLGVGHCGLPARLLSTYPKGGERRDFSYLQPSKVKSTPRWTGELSLKEGNTLFGEDVCEARVSSLGIGCARRAWAPSSAGRRYRHPSQTPKGRAATTDFQGSVRASPGTLLKGHCMRKPSAHAVCTHIGSNILHAHTWISQSEMWAKLAINNTYILYPFNHLLAKPIINVRNIFFNCRWL